jgi:hypothetical protein
MDIACYISAPVHILRINKPYIGQLIIAREKNKVFLPLDCFAMICFHLMYFCKGKTIPSQAWTGPEDSRRLGLPDFKTVGT